MTRVYDEKGVITPVTVIEAGGNTILQKKTMENDGYNGVQLGFDGQKEHRVTQQMLGHFKKASSEPKRFVREFRLPDGVKLDDAVDMRSERQIDDIEKNHKLLRDLKIVAPGRDSHGAEELKLSSTAATAVSLSIRQRADENIRSENVQSEHDIDHAEDNSNVPLILQQVLVHKGETVAAGTTLGALADYSELYIEGRAFEQDVELLSQIAQRNWKVVAVFEGAANTVKRVDNLDLVYSASEIDAEARSLSFFVRLPNEVAREIPSPNGQRFLDWKYRPGQRLQLLVPVEEWEKQIVLPVDAIAREGAESFVFQQNGSHFDRVSIRVAYRDSTHVVVANDGSIFAGDVMALRGAHQMQMALKNKSGGGVDPHAGHNH